MVVKMQPNGALEWVKLFPEAGTNNVEDLVATDDGGRFNPLKLVISR